MNAMACMCVEKEQDKGKMRHMINTLRFILVEYFYHFKEIETTETKERTERAIERKTKKENYPPN